MFACVCVEGGGWGLGWRGPELISFISGDSAAVYLLKIVFGQLVSMLTADAQLYSNQGSCYDSSIRTRESYNTTP